MDKTLGQIACEAFHGTPLGYDNRDWSDSQQQWHAAAAAVIVRARPQIEAEIHAELAAANKRADEAERDAQLLREQNAQLTDLNHGQFLKLEYLTPICEAAKSLSDEALEYDFPDGLGQGASQEYWDALNSAFEPKTDAIAEALKNGFWSCE